MESFVRAAIFVFVGSAVAIGALMIFGYM